MRYTFEGITEKIAGKLALRRMSVQRLAEAMEVRGCPISRDWLAKKIKEPRRFDLGELAVICDILDLNIGELVVAA